MQNQTQFTVSHNDENFGPFSREEIASRLTSGEFSPVDFVYVEEKSDWITLLEFLPEAGAAKEAPVKRVDEQTVPQIDLRVVEKAEEPVQAKAEVKPEPKAEPKVVEVAEEKDQEKTVVQTAKAEKQNSKNSKAAAPTEKLELKDGVGTVDFVQTAAGSMQLRLKLPNGKTLELPQPVGIVVKAAPAERVEMKGPSESVAGQACTFTLEAFDKYGNLDSAFRGSVSVIVSGSAEGPGKVTFTDGKAQFKITNKVAEKINVKLQDSEKLGLELNARCDVVYKAAPAARLEVVAPQELVAGQAAKLTVKAFDAFGNLATDFGGVVNLEVDKKSNVA